MRIIVKDDPITDMENNLVIGQQIMQLEKKVAALRTDLEQINEKNRLFVNLESTCKNLEKVKQFWFVSIRHTYISNN